MTLQELLAEALPGLLSYAGSILEELVGVHNAAGNQPAALEAQDELNRVNSLIASTAPGTENLTLENQRNILDMIRTHMGKVIEANKYRKWIPPHKNAPVTHPASTPVVHPATTPVAEPTSTPASTPATHS